MRRTGGRTVKKREADTSLLTKNGCAAGPPRASPGAGRVLVAGGSAWLRGPPAARPLRAAWACGENCGKLAAPRSNPRPCRASVARPPALVVLGAWLRRGPRAARLSPRGRGIVIVFLPLVKAFFLPPGCGWRRRGFPKARKKNAGMRIKRRYNRREVIPWEDTGQHSIARNVRIIQGSTVITSA